MADLFASDAELSGIGASARAEWSAEERAWAQRAFEQWQHGRSLADVARDTMHRGDEVAVDVAGARFAGTITAVGADVIRIDGRHGSVVVNLASGGAVLRTTEAARAGGTRGDENLVNLRAALLRHELERHSVVVGTSTGEQLRGAIVVGADHVQMLAEDGLTSYVALDTLVWVTASPD